MAESLVQVTEGSGKKLHTWARTVGANSVEDEFTLPGEYPYPSYFAYASGIGCATAGDDILQIMAGASAPVRVRSIFVEASSLITAAAEFSFQVLRLTSAGTGGTAITPRPHEVGDTAGATAMSGVPNATHGTAGFPLFIRRLWPVQTIGTGGSPGGFYTEWRQARNAKPIIIPAGITNGLALRIVTGRAGLTVDIVVELVEAGY